MKLCLSVAAFVYATVLAVPVCAQDQITVATCPRSGPLPVRFQVDCSHVADPSAKAFCKPFAENQACKVFEAYRTITGIHLEDTCPVFTYTIYDKGNFPSRNTDAGGFALRCGAELMADYSVLVTSPIGPYDVHEILHVYQEALGALPYQHILFAPSMTEARHLIGDDKGYATEFVQMKQDFNRTKADLESGRIKTDNECLTAELYEESLLYLKDHSNVELFYSTLQRGGLKDMADRQARFNRMYDAVSGGEARPFLLAHGCPRF
jgi:hypothetical protein